MRTFNVVRAASRSGTEFVGPSLAEGRVPGTPQAAALRVEGEFPALADLVM